MVLSTATSFGQASLPLSRTNWATVPTGWSSTGTGTYNTDCPGSTDASSGQLNSTGDFFTVNFSSPPTALTYSLKGNSYSGGSFDILESPDGTTWTNVRTLTTEIGSSCSSFSDALLSNTRFVRFFYTLKSAGNIAIDNVSITGGFSGPAPATALNITNACINAMSLNWTLPSSYSSANNTQLVFAKAGSPINTGTATSGVASYSADSDFSGIGTAYELDPLAKCIYKGDGNTVNITGLSAGTNYYFLIYNVVDGTSTYSPPALLNGNTGTVSPISNADATSGNGQIALTWLNPIGCYDEILVLGKTGTISDTPTGDGTGTVASNAFGSGSSIGASTAVYKGTGTTVTINSLTNGISYCFKAFVRKGNTWSPGVEVCAVPNTSSGTILYPGDISIVGYDANTGASNDLIAFVNLVDLNPGTSFLVTDNGFEINAASGVRDYSWGSGEGVMKLTWNGPGILAKGSVTTYETNTVIPGWTKTCISDRDGSSNGCIENNFNFSTAGDQLFILQGTWTEGNYTCGTTFYGSGATACADASFSGRYISAFNGISPGWISTSQTPMAVAGAGNGARNSRLPRELRCFNIENTTVITRLQYKNSAPRSGPQRTILGNIKTIGNWATFTSGSFALGNFTVGSGWTAGKWIGDISTNWFDCANWDNLYVPDENTDVLIGPAAVDDADVDASAQYSDEYLDIAKSKNLVINAHKVTLEGSANDKLEVYGNITINAVSGLDMSDGNTGTPDGKLYLYGNWTNLQDEVEFKQGESTVYLVGTGNQTISSNTSNNETFYNLVINKPTGNVNLAGDDDITIDPAGTMTFTKGIVNSNKSANAYVIFQNTASATGANTLSFVDGPVQKISSSTSPFAFPIGDVLSTTGTQLFRPLGIAPSSSSSTVYESEYTGLGYGDYTLGSGVMDVTTKEWWRLDRNSGTANTSVKLTWGTESDIATELTTSVPALVVAHFDGTDWDSQGGIGHTGDLTNGTATSTASGNAFGPFTLGTTVPLPIRFIHFSGKVIASGAELSWQTTNHANIQSFQIEKSTNGIDFTAIETLASNATGTNYSHIDHLFISGAYYRIKGTDQEGKISLSKTIRLVENREGSMLTVIPNPFDTEVTIQETDPSKQELNYQAFLTSPTGNRISEHSGDIITLNAWLKNTAAYLSAGIYLLSLTDSESQITHHLKLIKQ